MSGRRGRKRLVKFRENMKTTPTLEFENREIKKAKQTKSEQRRVSIEISMELEYVRVSARIPLTFMVI